MAEFAIEQLAEWDEIENVITETCITKVDDLPKSTERSSGRWGHRVYATLAASLTKPLRVSSIQFIRPIHLRECIFTVYENLE